MAKSSAGCTMYFIRHGEKPAEGEPNVNGLSKQGEKRAQFIAKLFNGSNSNAIGIPFQRPTEIIAAEPKGEKRQRMQLTVLPLGNSIGVPVTLFKRGPKTLGENTTDAIKGVKELDVVKYLQQKISEKKNHVILVCWEHHILVNMLKLLGPSHFKELKWPKEDFDSVFIYENGTWKKTCEGFN